MTREEAIAELNVLHERLSNPKDCEDGCYSWEDGWYVEAIDMAIEALSADTTQGEWIKHKGEWIDLDFYPTKYECSQCHYYVDEGYDSIFCPNCGARMKGGTE